MRAIMKMTIPPIPAPSRRLKGMPNMPFSSRRKTCDFSSATIRETLSLSKWSSQNSTTHILTIHAPETQPVLSGCVLHHLSLCERDQAGNRGCQQDEHQPHDDAGSGLRVVLFPVAEDGK